MHRFRASEKNVASTEAKHRLADHAGTGKTIETDFTCLLVLDWSGVELPGVRRGVCVLVFAHGFVHGAGQRGLLPHTKQCTHAFTMITRTREHAHCT